MKMKSREEKEKWKDHARNKRRLTLSGLIRQLMHDDIEDNTPKVDPIVLQNEMKELKEINKTMLTFLRYPRSEESQSIKWAYEYVEDQLTTKIKSIVRQGKIRDTLIKETKEIFQRGKELFMG